MKILQVHNFYQQAGGEDQVFAAEYDLLRRRGHFVRQYSVSNNALQNMGPVEMALKSVWNNRTFRDIERLLRDDPADVVHCHNTFPLISPAVYYGAEAAGVPVVQTLHNYRLLCPASTFYRDGNICEECLHSALPYPGVLHACYRNSHAASAGLATMLAVHYAAGTWRSKVDTYIALTDFARAKFLEAGFPAERVIVKPNFVCTDPGPGKGDGGFALFIGRLVEEKGLRTLLKAWGDLPSVPLKVAGTGPLATFVEQRSAEMRNIQYLGHCDRKTIFELLHSAAILVCPSEWYEGLPTTMIESFACGTPVLCSALGSMNETVHDGVNGARFEPGNPSALADVIRSLFSDPARLLALRHGARREYQERYTPEDNYAQLIRIYETATALATSSRTRADNILTQIIHGRKI